MAEYRTIRMSFWNDPFIEELEAEEKLLYLYLFSCPHTSNLGVLEISRKRMAFECALTVNTVQKGLDKLCAAGKVVHQEPDHDLPQDSGIPEGYA